jgi:hypothetical protein
MKKIIEAIKWFAKHPKFKTFLWQTLNGFLVVSIAILGELEWQYIPVLLAVLNYITKAINKKLSQ